MVQSRNVNIKKTLAYSLHEVARILAEGALVEEELLPVFEEMLQVCAIILYTILCPFTTRTYAMCFLFTLLFVNIHFSYFLMVEMYVQLRMGRSSKLA